MKALRPWALARTGRLRISLIVMPTFELACLFAQPAAAEAAQSRAPLPPLTQVAKVRELAPEEAKRGYPVRLTAVVTYSDPTRRDLFLQDSTAGIWVDVGTEKVPALRAGERVEVEAISAFTDFAPQLAKPHIRVIGEAPLPRPGRASFHDLMSGTEDSQWVAFEGVVRSTSSQQGLTRIEITQSQNRLTAVFLNDQGLDTGRLVGAKVRVEGVCASTFNPKGQLLGVFLHVPGREQFRVEEIVPSDAFATPSRPISSLMRFRSGGEFEHRVRVDGAVMLTRPGRSFFVGDGTGNLYVETNQSSPLAVGDHVEVLGFPAVGDFQPILTDAVYRKTGRGAVPAAASMSAGEPLSGDLDAELIQTRGRLAGLAMEGPNVVLVMSADGRTFNAYLDSAQGGGQLALLKEGSRLELTGICLLRVDENRTPRGFRLLLRSPADVTVLERPPWWTLWHTLLVLSVMAVVILAALAWVLALRHKVEEQTGVLKRRLERISALEERYRELFENANDMVFTCGLRGHLVSLNQAGERITGHSRDEVVGREIATLVAPEYTGLVEGLFEPHGEGEGGARNFQVEILTKDRRRVPVEISANWMYSGRTAVGVQGIARDITERKRAEEALAEERDLFHTLMDNIPDTIYFKDIASRFTRINKAQAELLGVRNPEDALGKTDFDFFSPEQAAEFLSEEAKIIETGRPLVGKLEELRRPDGQAAWFLCTEMPIKDKQGQVVGIVGISRDITERKRAEEALRRSESRFRRLSESGMIGIMVGDFTGGIVEANDVYLRTLGYTREDLEAGKIRWDAIHSPEYQPQHDRIIRYIQTIGVCPPIEIEQIRKDGTRVPTLLGLAALEGGESRAIGFLLDLTEQKQSERALRERTAYLDALMENSPTAIVLQDKDGIVRFSNPAFQRLFQYQEPELIGRNLDGLLASPEGLEKARELSHRVMLGELIHASTRRRRKDGTSVDVELFGVPLRVEGRLLGTYGLYRDISERLRAERELQKAKEAAEAASRAKSEFLAIMSHEIRTPMNGILGMTELALETELDPVQREYMQVVKSSADSLLSILNDILDFSKIEAGKFELDIQEFDLPSSLGSLFKALALKAHEKGLELAYRIEPEVPRRLLGDPGRLRQVLVNLIGNAIKFTERGEVIVRVRRAPVGPALSGAEGKAESGASDHCVLEFTVSDTGPGIPPDKQGRIFQAFTQADSSTTRRYGGTGLGLSISSRLVALMGGQIGVESQVGRGSTFQFTARFGLAAPAGREAGEVESLRLSGLSVLVADDNSTNRHILGEMLSGWGMLPVLVANGEDSLATMREASARGKPFPLVLLDSRMPDMDGFTVAREIKKTPTLACAIIMLLTSAGIRGDAARCRELGIRAYLTKPVRQSELLEAIQAVLARPADSAVLPPLVTRHSLAESRRVLRILLVEDNEVNQTYGLRVLERAGHQVRLASNGREALEVLENAGKFDVVLMDVEMPEMDGLEATDAVRKKEKSAGGHLPIIAMTAHAMEGDRERFRAAGMDGYIAKPIRPMDLLQSLDRILAEARSSAPLGTGGAGQRQAEDASNGAATLIAPGMNAALVAEIADLFLKTCPETLEQARQALDRGDARSVECAGHKLKGSVSHFAAPAAYEAAANLERAAHEGDTAETRKALRALESEIERLRPALSILGKGDQG